MPDAITPLERIAFVFASICGKVADRGGRDHATIPMVWLIWTRLRRMAKLLTALIARFEAGTLRAPRPHPVARRTREARVIDPAAPRAPTAFGWLGQFAPEANQFGGHVQVLLDDPRMLALLEAAPQAGRFMRPLCRMFAIPVPQAWRLPRRRTREVAANRRTKAGERKPAEAPRRHRPTALSGPSPGLVPRCRSGGGRRRRYE